ncbi:hypothetical protein ACHAXS_002927 [Conticribra weissflogii]
MASSFLHSILDSQKILPTIPQKLHQSQGFLLRAFCGQQALLFRLPTFLPFSSELRIVALLEPIISLRHSF